MNSESILAKHQGRISGQCDTRSIPNYPATQTDTVCSRCYKIGQDFLDRKYDILLGLLQLQPGI